ncbi:ABC transporter ATP-binding protein [Azospira sp. I13]|uniref:ATP-binding cassette domain-containing protein n=1 Tax=Azospira sp. I13 TaxID=1765050 RepID=UPI000D42B071|nr:ATP-binding cassette domain-containing protein [Azospira sp. I13]GBG01556.1 ABC transporter ATP-binding protein [Azospira sp. I13]
MRPVLVARELVRRYPVGRRWFGRQQWLPALNGVSLSLDAGRTLAVVGESGSGKSTLARLLALVDDADGGSLEIAGTPVNDATRRQLRPRVQMVFQNPYGSLNPRQSIGAVLEEPLIIHTDLGRAQRRHRVADMLEQVGLRPEFAARYPHMFSGGQRQRVAIARAMILQPQVVIADEPTSALDVSIQAQILNLFTELQKRHGTSFVFISHDLSVVRHIADEVMVMYRGSVVEQAPAATLFDSPQHSYTQALLAATPTLVGQRRRGEGDNLRQLLTG